MLRLREIDNSLALMREDICLNLEEMKMGHERTLQEVIDDVEDDFRGYLKVSGQNNPQVNTVMTCGYLWILKSAYEKLEMERINERKKR